MKDPKKKTIRVVIVDDHPGVRMGLKILCSQENDISVEGEGSTGVDAMVLVRTVKPDVLLLDVELPIFKGYKVVNRIRELELEVQVLAVSSHHNPYLILEMLENGSDNWKLSRYLLNLERQSIGVTGDVERCAKVAQSLIDMSMEY